MTITVDWDIEHEINETNSNVLSCHLINFNSLPWLIQYRILPQFKGAWWPGGETSDSESKGPVFDSCSVQNVVSLSKTH